MTKRMLTGMVFGHSRQIYDFDGRMEDVIKALSDLKAQAEAEGYTNLTMSVPYGYSGDDVDWTIHGDRLETDREYEQRLSIERRVKEQKRKDKKEREAHDRREYERLRKKFEGK